MKRLVAAVAAILALVSLTVIGCTNTDLVGPEPGDEAGVASSCVTCHTDEDLLQELAVEEEEVTSEETTGEG